MRTQGKKFQRCSLCAGGFTKGEAMPVSCPPSRKNLMATAIYTSTIAFFMGKIGNCPVIRDPLVVPLSAPYCAGFWRWRSWLFGALIWFWRFSRSTVLEITRALFFILVFNTLWLRVSPWIVSQVAAVPRKTAALSLIVLLIIVASVYIMDGGNKRLRVSAS